MSVCGQQFVCPDCAQPRAVRESVVLADAHPAHASAYVSTWRSCSACAMRKVAAGTARLAPAALADNG